MYVLLIPVYIKQSFRKKYFSCNTLIKYYVFSKYIYLLFILLYVELYIFNRKIIENINDPLLLLQSNFKRI